MMDSTFEVVNVVGTGQLPTELAIEPLKEDLDGHAFENDSPQPGLHLQFEEDGPMTTFYRSGKYIIRSPSVEILTETEAAVRDEISRLGILDRDYETGFAIQNVVANGAIDVEQVNLRSITIALGLEHTEYEPEQFPALTYRKPEYPCTFLLFSNGKVVIAGADTVDGAESAFESFVEELAEWL